MSHLGFWNDLSGMIEIEVTSATAVDAMNAANMAGIQLSSVRVIDDLTFSCTVERRNVRALLQLLRRRGDNPRILRRTGLYWSLAGLRKRPVLVFGILFLIAFSLYLPTRVLFIAVEGNHTIQTTRILDEAENCGIRFGAARRSVRSEQMKNKLLGAIPDLEWAGINTYGCLAVISVRERTIENGENGKTGASSIVAERDGVVHSITATAGNPLCHVGQAVTAGQVLISGYTDCGLTIKAQRSVGEIMAYTSRDLTLITPQQSTRKGAIIRTQTKYSIIFGKKLINLSQDSGISDTSCDKIYEINYITLPGGFVLPAAVVAEHTTYRESSDQPREDAQQWMPAYAKDYIQKQMIAGQVLHTIQNYQTKDGLRILTSRYACLEMIGREQKEEIMINNGKNG